MAAPAEIEREVVRAYAAFLASAYEDSLDSAREMEKQIAAFVGQPTSAGLERPRAAWIAARGPYLMTEIGRFYGGPIDDGRNIEDQLNAWPVDESFIEGAPDSPSPGLVQNEREFPELTPAVLARLNARGGEENISCGWHAIEFLLWGPDIRADAPGQRRASDFATDRFASRRCAFLLAATRLLVDDLDVVAREWKAAPGTYRAEFEAAPAQALAHIFTALYQLSGFEMASERLLIGIDTQSQEDEPDCFSDTTSQDFLWNARAMAGVWHGRWTRRDGSKLNGRALREFVAARNKEMGHLLDEKFAECLAQAEKLPAPFDQIILQPDGTPEKEALLRFAEGLEFQADLLAHFAREQNLEIEFEHAETPVSPRGTGEK
ncbi:MAG: imelysin family protein [Verrucomicrobiales bacterium]